MQEDKGYVVLCRIVDRKEECVEKAAKRIRLGERNKYLIRCYFSEDYLGGLCGMSVFFNNVSA